jgi:hypothetical protein
MYMSLRIRFQYPAGGLLGFSIERLSDGLLYDFAVVGPTSGSFTANPTVAIAGLPADTGNFVGRYKTTLATTPASQFTDGDYCVSIHNLTTNNTVVAELQVEMHGGDDAPVSPSQTWGADPWATMLPGTYPPGSAGATLGGNLDAKVSSRSTFAGTAVASVTAPVTVGVNNDKVGYALSPVGLETIGVETGVNARQALSAILAAAAGTLSGAGTGTIVIKGGNVNTTRITATSDSSGNRTSVVLALPN